jgi:very-short-patch-repair endonuclease
LHNVIKSLAGKGVKLKTNNLEKYKTDQPSDYKESNGETAVRDYLDKRGLYYEKEVVFDALNFLRFDYYLPQYKLAIEFDGVQHFKKVDAFGDTDESLEKRRRFDKIKNKFIFGNNGVMIRVRYYDDVEEILIAKLKKHFPGNKELYE